MSKGDSRRTGRISLSSLDLVREEDIVKKLFKNGLAYSVMDREGTIYQASVDAKKLSATDWNGNKKWELLLPFPAKAAVPAILNGTIYFYIHRYDKIEIWSVDQNGKEKGVFTTGASTEVAPFTIGSDGRIYFGL